MDFSEIRRIVRKRWAFESDSYPDLLGMNSQGTAIRFTRAHILKHVMKNAGKMAEIEEAADHGNKAFPDAKERMCALIGKMMMNLMQLAASYGISNKEIEKYIRKEGTKPT